MSKVKVNTELTDGIVLRRRQLFEEMPRKKAREGEILPPDPSIVPIDVAGDLHKLGRVFKTWVKRYFEVQGTKMYYYKSDQKKLCMGYIDLLRCHFIGRSSVASFGSPFELQTEDRTHILAARTESDMRQWISVIKTKLLPEASKRQRRATKFEKSAAAAAAATAAAATAAPVEPSFQTRRATVKRHRSFMSSRMHRTNLSSISSSNAEEEGGKVLQSQRSTTVADDAAVDIRRRPSSATSDELPVTLAIPATSFPTSSSFHGFESTTATQLEDKHDSVKKLPQVQTESVSLSGQHETATEETLSSQPLPGLVQAEILEPPAPVEAPPLKDLASNETVIVQQQSLVEENHMLESAEAAESQKLPQLTATEPSQPEPQIANETSPSRQQQQSTMEIEIEPSVLSEEAVMQTLPSEQFPLELQEDIAKPEHMQQQIMASASSSELPQQPTPAQPSSSQQPLEQGSPSLLQPKTMVDTLPSVEQSLPTDVPLPELLEQPIPLPVGADSVLAQTQQQSTAFPQEQVEQPISLPVVADSVLAQTQQQPVAFLEDQVQQPIPLPVVTDSVLAQTQQQPMSLPEEQVETVAEDLPPETSPQIQYTRSQLQMQQQQRLRIEEQQQRLGEQQANSSAIQGEEKSAIQQLRALLEAEEDSFLQEPDNDQDQPSWLQEKNSIDQLKHFLQVCA